MQMKQAKQINKIKMTLTTRCDSGCKYCFVKRTHERMSSKVALAMLDLILNSPGDDKLVALFGGEPFLEFDLIREITGYAKAVAGQNGKQVTVSVCTNLTILTEQQIEFIKDQGLKITVSLVGKKDDHDRFRFFTNGRGTYEQVIRNLEILSKKIPAANLGISFVVMPSLSQVMFDQFRHLIDLGFSTNINLEIVEGFEEWGKTEQLNFMSHFNKIIDDVEKSLDTEAPIYLNPINWELAYNQLSERQSVYCPFQDALEIYPSGDMAFSPFLLNRDDKARYIVGNVLTQMQDAYSSCGFDSGSEVCGHCAQNYFRSPDKMDNAERVREFYNLTCLRVAARIRTRHPAYAAYCKEYLCF